MRLIDKEILDKLRLDSSLSERKRSHYLLHNSHQDKVQRLLIHFIKGSYVEPHFHELAHQWEMFIVLSGEIKVCLYNEQGLVVNTILAGPGHSSSVLELSPGDIHSVECLSDEAIILEVKEGPFDNNFAKSFPDWS